MIESDVIPARRAIAMIRSDASKESFVHTQGNFYRYNEKLGIWQIFPRYAFSKVLQTLDTTMGEFPMTKSRIESTISCARDLLEQPDFFVQRWRAAVFTNGIITVTADKVEFLPHTPDAHITLTLPFAYDANAECPRWLQFLHEVFAGDDDAIDKIRLLQEFYGIAMIQCATQFQQVLVLVGEGANGKSVALYVLEHLFTPESRVAIPPHDLKHDYKKATLSKAALNLVYEMPEAEVFATEAFKAVVAGDFTMGRHPYGQAFGFQPTAAHVFAANRLPHVADASDGFWRRILPIGFNNRFVGDGADQNLRDKIVTTEMPGIAKWALEGASRALKLGKFTVPASAPALCQEWRMDSDQVAQFIEDCCTNGEFVLGSDLYNAYYVWADHNGHRRLANNTFAARMRGLGYRKKHSEVGNVWLGLTLR